MDLPRVERKPSGRQLPQAPRPLQNRVDPFGEFHAVAERGGLMGNRGGRLHRDDRTLSGRRWKIEALDRLRLRVQGPAARRVGQSTTPSSFSSTSRPRSPRGIAPASSAGAKRRRPFSPLFPGAPSGVDAMDEALHRERVENRAQTPLAGAARRPAGRGDDRARRARLRRALRSAFAMELRRLWRAGAARAGRRRRRADPALDRRRAQSRLSSALGGGARASP